MVGLGIACSKSVIRNLAIVGNFTDMSQLFNLWVLLSNIREKNIKLRIASKLD